MSTDYHANQFLSDLKRSGLASDDYPKVLRSVKERRISIAFKGFGGESAAKEGETLSTGQVGDAVLELVFNATTNSRHLLSIDGLDKAITDNEAYWQTLAALIRVADHFRRTALNSGARNVFLLVMCRSDVFRRVHLADAPKIAADGGIHLEWHAEAANPRKVLLWEYLARKAEVDLELLLDFLPRSVRVGKAGGVETLKYLIEFTRYTPRDATLLFNELQRSVQVGQPIEGAMVREAADRFATNHLLQEIVAEATGLLPAEVVQRIQAVVAALPRRVFTATEFDQALVEAEVHDLIRPRELGEYLFLQGAIGNFDSGSGYFQFYHRRDVYEYRPKGPWALHTGLSYAMNKPW